MTSYGSKNVNIDVWLKTDVAENIMTKGAMKGLRKWGEVVLAKAQKTAPVDTGALIRSGTVQSNSSQKKITISFNTPYARRQHEEHKSKSKYLELAYNEMSSKLMEYVEDAATKAYINAKYSDKAIFTKKYPDLKWNEWKDKLY